VVCVLVGFVVAPCVTAAGPVWREKGVWAREDYFPIGVWLQKPASAGKYKAIGVNLYGDGRGDVVGRTVDAAGGRMSDAFDAYGVHVYKFAP
jgi:hypothetical protein